MTGTTFVVVIFEESLDFSGRLQHNLSRKLIIYGPKIVREISRSGKKRWRIGGGTNVYSSRRLFAYDHEDQGEALPSDAEKTGKSVATRVGVKELLEIQLRGQ